MNGISSSCPQELANGSQPASPLLPPTSTHHHQPSLYLIVVFISSSLYIPSLLYFNAYSLDTCLTVLTQSLTMSTIMRTLRNLRKIGLKEYGHQMQYMGDTKAGTFIAQDRYGNKYYENVEDQLPCMRYLSPPSPSPSLTSVHSATPNL